MALIDVQNKRATMYTKIDAYKQAVRDFNDGLINQATVDAAKLEAQQAGDALAKEIDATKRANPEMNVDDLFSKPALMDALRRDDIATIMRFGQLQKPLRIRIKTDRNTLGAKSAYFPFAAGCDVTVDWGDGNVDENVTGSISHVYATAGEYEVAIKGTINGFQQASSSYDRLILDVIEWGTVEFASAAYMFSNRKFFAISATDSPNFLPGANIQHMFYLARAYGNNASVANIANWNTSQVVKMQGTFANSDINVDISGWNTSAVTDMAAMFENNDPFLQDLSGWDVGNVVDYRWFINGADSMVNNPSYVPVWVN